jgi:uncharacterized protein
MGLRRPQQGAYADKGGDARMTQAAKSLEPSMEEILASIRRIIADDDASKTGPREAEAPKPAPRPAAPPPRPAPPVAPPKPSAAEIYAEESAPAAMSGVDVEDQASDILDLTESMAAPPPAPPAPGASHGPPPQFRKIDGHFDVSFDDTVEKSAAQRSVEPARGQYPRETNTSDDHERAQLLSSETSAAVDSAFNTLAQTVLVQNARTLEDLVREMLRPMLKTWLDDNLPGMVERLVRAEIERVARGRVG